MKINRSITTSMKTFCIGIVISLFSLSVMAEEGPIRFSNNAFKQVIHTEENGDKRFSYVEPTLVLPGDVILYEIEFENTSDQVISDIVVNNPLPENTIYRGGSAMGRSTEISFSIDGEKFDSATELLVKDESGQTRLARAEEYTALRWIYTKALKPGEKSKVAYKTEIKK